jgi:hypothetical protein
MLLLCWGWMIPRRLQKFGPPTNDWRSAVTQTSVLNLMYVRLSE